MARRRHEDAEVVELRRHLADRLRRRIARFAHSPEAVAHWSRELERLERGDEVTFYGWQARGPVALPARGVYRLDADNRVEAVPVTVRPVE